ncbi:MAG: DUF3794 and LysM peptidoglycan-binding domain-containing protein [Clostridia bacterium]
MAEENTAKETLCINQMIGKKIDTMMVEEDFVVPDIKPDILSTIHTNGTVCIYKKEVLDGKIKIDGCINVYIMYLADDENASVRSLNTNLEFSQIVDFDKVKESMMLEQQVTLKSVECRVLNGRKVSVKAIMDMELKVFSNEEVEFIKQIDTVPDVQLLNENLRISSLLGTGTTKVYAKDTIMIDNVDDLAEIMKVDVLVKNKETKISYNKVLAKADANVKIVYLTTDNRINMISNNIPVMGFIDMPNVADEHLCDMQYEIKNVLMKPNNVEEHSIYVEIELELSAHVYETKDVNVIQDLYSPTVNLAYKQKMIKAMSEKQIITDVCAVREKQFINEIGNHKIYDVDVLPSITKQTVLKDRIIYEGELALTFLFAADNSSRMSTQNVNLPFHYTMDCIGIDQNSQVETNMELIMQDFVVMPDESMDIKIDLQFSVQVSNVRNINVIEEIAIEETRKEERYSLVIYFVKPGDTLWNIAKRFKSTVPNIVKMNEIENENKINVGEQLFIPMSR